MKITKLAAIALSAVLCLSTLTACGSKADKQSVEAVKKNGKLVVYTNAEFAPFEYLKDGKPAGVDIDIAQAIADELGVKLEIKDVKFESVLSAISSGKASIGASGLSITDERKETMDFSIPYTKSVQYIIVKEDFEISKFEDLAGKKIGVQSGTTGDYIVTDEINGYKDDDDKDVKGVIQDTGAEVKTYANAPLAAKDILEGRIDAVVIDKLPAESIVKQNSGLKCVEFIYADGGTTEEEYAIALTKGNDSLLAEVNKVLDKMIKDGTIEELILKHSNN